MLVKCIDKVGESFIINDLVIGETYKVVNILMDDVTGEYFYQIQMWKGTSIGWVKSSNFIEINVLREQKIDLILDI